MNDVTPVSLKDAPALIQSVFPAQKVSYEAQRERKANLGQTLTGLGSYWKGRKPLILVRAILLGTLLPQTEDAEKDLEIFEKLMALDEHGLARRALAQGDLKPKDIAARIDLSNPWDYFTFSGHADLPEDNPLLNLECPFDAEQEGISLRWRRDTDDEARVALIERALATFPTYEEKASFCKRPEEVSQEWLYAPIWPAVNEHYQRWGLKARSFGELVEQLGVLRFGHKPRVGDTFAGGGSIPFEAARLGCDVYGSDLNPIASLLTWGALHIIGASPKRRRDIKTEQEIVARAINEEIEELGIETNKRGDRAKSFLYCMETRCPETGWQVPMSPSWVISKSRRVIAELEPIHAKKRFEIKIVEGASSEQMKRAQKGTIAGNDLVYELDGRTYRTPLRTLRGDYRDPSGTMLNRLRRWERLDFQPRPDDIFTERLYAIHWVEKQTIWETRQSTFFKEVTEQDLEREHLVEKTVSENLAAWQKTGLVPDMGIEPGYNTDQPIRERGWTHWHHFFNPRQLLVQKAFMEHARSSELAEEMLLFAAKVADWNNRGCHWHTGWDKPENLFYNQALDTFWNYGARSSYFLLAQWGIGNARFSDLSKIKSHIASRPADSPDEADIYVTDPPYADAVNYHEITEFFIAWLRRNPPEEFRDWTWDSRRALAIKGSGDDFRRGMVDAYRAMAEHMPDNGMQCVMFTHQDTGVWSDMVGIFWAAGLQVVAAWYIATETTSELKKGGYVQGTVILMLRKRPAGERSGFKQRILPAVRTEVERQIESMMHLNEEVKDKLGEPVFNDSDLQMAGYAAALKVLTAYTHIGGDDVTSFALRPRQRGEETVVDEIVQQAAEAANSLLVPEGLEAETWSRLTGIQRFYFRMMDMETTGASKLDNYQNFAKAFRVADYGKVMGNMAANSARLKRVTEFASRDLTDSTEIGPTWLGRLIIGLQQLLAETEPAVVVGQIQEDLPDFLEIRPLLIDMLSFIERKAPEQEVRDAAEVLGGRLKNLRAFSQ